MIVVLCLLLLLLAICTRRFADETFQAANPNYEAAVEEIVRDRGDKKARALGRERYELVCDAFPIIRTSRITDQYMYTITVGGWTMRINVRTLLRSMGAWKTYDSDLLLLSAMFAGGNIPGKGPARDEKQKAIIKSLYIAIVYSRREYTTFCRESQSGLSISRRDNDYLIRRIRTPFVVRSAFRPNNSVYQIQ